MWNETFSGIFITFLFWDQHYCGNRFSTFCRLPWSRNQVKQELAWAKAVTQVLNPIKDVIWNILDGRISQCSWNTDKHLGCLYFPKITIYAQDESRRFPGGHPRFPADLILRSAGKRTAWQYQYNKLGQCETALGWYYYQYRHVHHTRCHYI